MCGTHTKSTTVIKLKGCSVKLQGSSRYYSVYDMLHELGLPPLSKGDRMLDLFCFTKVLTVWLKCPLNASLLRRVKALEKTQYEI